MSRTEYCMNIRAVRNAHRPIVTADADDKSTGWADQHPPLLRIPWRRSGDGEHYRCFSHVYWLLDVLFWYSNKAASYLENFMCWRVHLLSKTAWDGAGWPSITRCVSPRESVASLTAAPRNEYKIKRAHCSCLVVTARTRARTPPRACTWAREHTYASEINQRFLWQVTWHTTAFAVVTIIIIMNIWPDIQWVIKSLFSKSKVTLYTQVPSQDWQFPKASLESKHTSQASQKSETFCFQS